MSKIEHNDTPVNDSVDAPVWGAKAIGDVLNLSERQARHIIPKLKSVRRVGARHVAIPSKLRAELGGE